MSDARSGEITFSFIVPVYNEQEGLEQFYRRLSAVAEGLGEPYEIVFVNDGSEDETSAILHRLAAADPRVRAVEFSRNFGHQVAVTAGYDFAVGRAVISLDGDCQHPPEMVPEMVARWREGFEVVYTVRQDTQGISPLRRAVGRLAYGLIRLASGADLTDQADFRLLDRKAVLALRTHREHARLVRGLVRWIGFRQVAMPYTAEKRAAGRSSYTLRQLAGMTAAGVFNFSVAPLRAVAVLGGGLFALALLYAVVSLVLWPFGLAPGFAAGLVALLVGLFGLQFLILGMVGEYVGRIFDEAKARPLYVVRETIGLDRGRTALPSGDRPEAARRTDHAPGRDESGVSIFT